MKRGDMNLKTTIGCIIVASILISCKANDVSMIIPSSSPEGIVVTETPTPKATSTSKPKTPFSTKTPDFYATSSEIAYEKKETQAAGFPAPCEEPGRYEISPNGNWMAVNCTDNENVTLVVVNKEGIKWTLQYSDYLPVEEQGSLPMGGLYVAHWTDNEKYLYFYTYISVSGGGPCFYGYGPIGLFRLNLINRVVTTVLPLRDAFDGYLFSFSPDSKYLAYSTDKLIVREISTGVEKLIASEDMVHGDLTWSQDGSQLAYASCETDMDTLVEKSSSIEIYSMNNKTAQTIMASDGNLLRINYTGDENTLQIEKRDALTWNSSYYVFDWSTGKVKSIPMP